MARVAVEFYASGNFSPLLAQINAANAALRAQASQINAMGRGIDAYASKFKSAAAEMGGFNVSSHSVLNNTSRLTEQLRKQEIAWKDLGKVRKEAGAIAEAQNRLAQSHAVSFGNSFDRTKSVMMIPDQVTNSMKKVATEAQVMSHAYASALSEMEKRGKNMQWAGRQLTVGFTVPIVALGAASAKMAYDVDAALTRVVKVYGDTGNVAPAELEKVRKATFETAKDVARNFGIAGKETIDLAADFAAAGLQGEDLQRSTQETSRIIMLGELDKQKAFQTTLTIQSVFREDTKKLADTFNFLNAVENETSTTLQDLTESIPRVGGVIKSLGGSIKDAALFTVAFKQNGITAAQGANALRSSLGAILAPSKAANKTLEGMGINLAEIQKNAQGTDSPIMALLQGLGEELDKMAGPERQKALSTLFGRYQFNKMGQLITSLTHDVNDMATQTGRAFALTQASTEELAKIAEGEAKQIQNSISGRIKREWESLKVSLVDLGRKSLPVILAIVKAINDIVSAFKGLPGPIKSLAMFGIAVIAVVGPIKMLLGLSRNLIAQFGKFSLKIRDASIGTTELLTAEEALVKLTATQVLPAIKEQTAAWAELNAVIAETVAGKEGILVASGQTPRQAAYAMNPAMRNSPAARAAQTLPTGLVGPNGAPLSSSALQAQEEAAARAAQKTNTVLKNRIGIFAGVALAFSAMTGWAGKFSGALNAILLVLMVFPGILLKIGSAFKSLAAAEGAANFGSLATKVKAVSTNLKKMAMEALAAIGPWGALAAAIVLALGAVFFLLKRNYDKVNRDNEAVRKGAESMAKAVGAAWKESTKSVQSYNEETKKSISLSEKLAKENKALVDAIQDLQREQGDAAAVRRAEGFGVEMIKHGASPAKAKEAVEALLKAAGGDELKMKVTLDFTSSYDVDKRGAEKVSEDLARVVNNHFDQSAGEGFKRFWTGHSGGFWGFHNTDTLNEGARAAARQWADQFLDGLIEGMSNPTSNQAIADTIKDMQVEFANQRDAAHGDKQTLGHIDQTEGEVVARLKEKLKLQGEEAQQIQTLAQLQDYLTAHYHPLSEAVDEYNQMIREYLRAGVPVTEATKKQIALNIMSSGSYNGLTADMIMTADAAGTLASAMDPLKTATAEYLKMLNDPNLGGAFLSDLKSNLQGYTSDVIDEGMRLYDKATAAHERAMDKEAEDAEDSLQRQQEAQDKFFDKKKKGIDKTYDAKKKAVEAERDKALAALKKEDDARNAAFKAQMDRIQREADAANASIDINAALKSGDNDEAARIAANAYASAQKDDLQAANDAAQAASDKEKERINKTYDLKLQAVEDEKQKQLDILDVQKEAAKKQLDNTKKLERDKQRARREAYEETRAMERDNLQKSLKLYADAATANQTQFQQNLGKISDAFSAAGIKLDQKNSVFADAFKNAWTTSLRTATAEVAADKGWSTLGAQIARAAALGATGMDWTQLWHYLQTGELPKNYSGPPAVTGGPATNKPAPWHDTTPHAGGFIEPGFTGNRLGRNQADPRIYQDEIPAILQIGEGVVNRKGMQVLGREGLEALNAGAGGPDSTGRFHAGGLATGPALMSVISTYEMMKAAIRSAVAKKGLAGAPDAPPVSSVGPASGSLLARVVHAIMMQESGGNYGARSTISSASGAYQYIDGTWNNYKGYPHAYMAPPAVQDERATSDTNRRWGYYHDWEKVIAAHFYPAWASNKALWYQSPSPGNPTVWRYVAGVIRKGGLTGTPGFEIPQLRTGGMVLSDNTLANLHKGERVLTAPLSSKLDAGIERLASGGNVTYNVDVIVPDTNASPEKIAQVVLARIKHEEAAKGLPRRVK